jgi:hypothetical protein
MRWVMIGAICAILASATAQAATDFNGLLLQGSGTTRTVTCNNTTVMVEGARNVVTIVGHCSGLIVRGDSNYVSIPLTGAAVLDIEGNHNRVRTSSTPDATPQLRMTGQANEFTPNPASVAPAADTAFISGNGLSVELDCNGKLMTFDSVSSNLRLRGACAGLVLRGEANLIEASLAPGADVTIAGNAISLLYKIAGEGAEPNFNISGMDSLALPAASLGAALTRPTPPSKLPVQLLLQLLSAQVQANGTYIRLPAAAFNSTGMSPAGALTLQRLAGLILQAWPSAVKIVGQEDDPGAGKQLAAVVSEYLVSHGVPGLTADIVGQQGTKAVTVQLLN